jgi:hypothetical protein
LPEAIVTVPEGLIAPPALTIVLIDKSLVLDEVADDTEAELCEVLELDVFADDETVLETELLVVELLDSELAEELEADEAAGVVSLTPPPQADNTATNTKPQIFLLHILE